MLTDTHTHLCDAVFDADRSAVIARAEAAGIVAVGETLADAEKKVPAFCKKVTILIS